MATVQTPPEPRAVVGPESIREIETKFDVGGDFTVAGLGRFTSSHGRVQLDTVALASTYYDTQDMRLLRFHLTLRRRLAVGNTDDVGWQLKVPGAGFRTELHWPADGEDHPPPQLLELLAPFLNGPKYSGRELVAAIRLEVTRSRHRLLDVTGALIAEIADDEVRAVGLGVAVHAAQWREIEVELGPAGKRTDQLRMGRSLAKAGARPSPSRSKLARAVVGIGNESVGGTRASAGAALSDYLAAQVDAIVGGHFAIYGDVEDSVHQTRVACRRIRSTLGTFRRYFDVERADQFGDDLRWYASVLGRVRDIEVLRVRLAAVVASVAPELIVGPVAASVDQRLNEQLVGARVELLTTMRSARYAQLLAQLIEWRDSPPFTAAAGRPAATLGRAVRHANRVLHKRLGHATAPHGTDSQMHAARKAGKRARYATEAVRSGRAGGRVKRLQDLLGEFQDSVVAATVIRQLADEAAAAGEPTFTYGVLFSEERARATTARASARASERGDRKHA